MIGLPVAQSPKDLFAAMEKLPCRVPELPAPRRTQLDATVITAACDKQVQGAMLAMYSLLRHHECTATFYDLGVTSTFSELVDKMRSWGVQVVDACENGLVPITNEKNWQVWCKPLCMQNTLDTSQRVIWLDADTWVVSHLDDMPFPLITDHGRAFQRVDSASPVYDILGGKRGDKAPNTGVVAFDRNDCGTLMEWCDVVKQCAENVPLRRSMAYGDQGALNYVVNQNDGIRLADGSVWNRVFVENSDPHRSHKCNPHQLVYLSSIERRAKIFHFAGGRSKYWHAWCGGVIRSWPHPKFDRQAGENAQVSLAMAKNPRVPRSVVEQAVKGVHLGDGYPRHSQGKTFHEIERDEKLFNQKNDRLLITIAAGDTHEELFEVSEPFMRHYAERIEADVVVLKRRTQGWWGLEKFRVKRFAARYKRTLFVDADVLIKPDSPNIFDVVPQRHVGMHDDLPHNLKWTDRPKRLKELLASQGIAEFPTDYLRNSGVVVCDQMHAIWEPPQNPVPGHHVDEQFWMEYLSRRYAHFNLPTEFNLQWWMPQFQRECDNCWFLHLANCPSDQRLDLIQMHAERWKELL